MHESNREDAKKQLAAQIAQLKADGLKEGGGGEVVVEILKPKDGKAVAMIGRGK